MTFGGTEQRNRDRNIRKRQREKVEPKASQSTTRVPLCAIVHITGQERCEPEQQPHLYRVWKSGCGWGWRTGCCTGCCWRGSRSRLGPGAGAGAGLCGGGGVSSNLTDCARSRFGCWSLWPDKPFLLIGDAGKTTNCFRHLNSNLPLSQSVTRSHTR